MMGLLYQRLKVERPLRAFALYKIAEILNVSLRAADGRKREIKHGKARLLCMSQKMLQHLQVYRRVAYNALFPDLIAPCFKLRLDQAGNMPALLPLGILPA